MKILNILIVGGCFTEQNNIADNKLYHEVISRKFQRLNKIEINKSIVRYERLSKCLEKIVSAVEFDKPDILLFHARVEPVLRLTKLYYKYFNENNKLIKSINLSVMGKLNPELHKHNILRQADPEITLRKDKFIQHLLRELNYILGIIIGNFNYSVKIYLKLLTNVNYLTIDHGIKLIITGPVSRPHTFIENLLSVKLSNHFEYFALKNNISFIKCLGKYSEEGNYLFKEDGMCVNEAGHERIAGLIYDSIFNNS